MTKLSILPEKSTGSTAPKDLKPAILEWFDQVCGEYEHELESQHLRILQLAAEARESYEVAREAVAENGPFCQQETR